MLAAPFVAFPSDFISKALLDGGDDLVANLPELLYSGQKLLEGEIFWTPELWMGHPLLGEPEFATFYFPKLLLLVGSPVVAYAAYLVLHYLAAEIGAYLYLGTFGLGRAARVFGALAYAYSGFMLGHRAHTMYVCAGAWTPFVLLLFDRAAERGGRFRHAGAALAFAMVPFCGAVQLTVYLMGMLLTLGAARWFFERNARALVGTVACLIPGVMISAAQLVPSYDFSRQLATDMRSDYALDVMHSFHPLLFPTLAVPVPPLDAELYSRAGVIVLCAVAVALTKGGGAPSRIKAWMVMAGVALAIMFGKYLPVLPHLLHGLPVVGVLRGPARHNFELGLALSVLGAYGIEVARRSGIGPSWRWLAAGVVFAGASWAVQRLAAGGGIADVPAATLAKGVTGTAAVAATVAFAVWTIATRFRTAPVVRYSWPLLAIAPLLETAWVMRFESRSNRSALGLIEDARAALPDVPRWVRLLSVSLHRGSVDDLAGNSVLFHEGVESLQGYSSISYSAARTILDLDMHGQPSQYDELAFSILPSVFGVTHIVLPSAVCGDTRWILGDGEPCARGGALDSGASAMGLPTLLEGGGKRSCVVAEDTAFRYRLELQVRSDTSDPGGASFSFVAPPDWEPHFGFDVPGSVIGPAPARHFEPFALARMESWGALVIENRGNAPLDIVDAGLFLERERAGTRADERVYGFPIATSRYRRGVEVEEGRIRLDGKARVGGTMHLPVRAFEVLLDAQAPEPLTGPVRFGFETDSKYEVPRQWQIAADAFNGRARVHHVAVLPPDASDPKLFVAVQGAVPLRVNELSARDACTLRGYENPRRLANGLFLYENARAARRAYAVGRVVRATDAVTVRRALLDFEPADLGHRAVVQHDVPENLREGVVERASFGQRHDEIFVHSDGGPTLLVVNERFDPDWGVTIDGSPAVIMPANGFVRAVVVPEGRHEVRFDYRVPWSVWIGIGVSIAGVIAALLLVPALSREAQKRV